MAESSSTPSKGPLSEEDKVLFAQFLDNEKIGRKRSASKAELSKRPEVEGVGEFELTLEERFEKFKQAKIIEATRKRLKAKRKLKGGLEDDPKTNPKDFVQIDDPELQTSLTTALVNKDELRREASHKHKKPSARALDKANKELRSEEDSSETPKKWTLTFRGDEPEL